MNEAVGGGMTTAPECEERTLEVLASSPFSAGGSKRHGTRSKSGVTKPKLKTGEAAPEDQDAKPAHPKKQASAPKKNAPARRSESPSQGSSGSGSDGEEKPRMQGLLTALLSQCPEETEGAKPKAVSRKRKLSAASRGASSKKAAIEVHDDDDDDDGTKAEKEKLSAEQRADLARTRNRQHARRTRHRAKQQVSHWGSLSRR